MLLILERDQAFGGGVKGGCETCWTVAVVEKEVQSEPSRTMRSALSLPSVTTEHSINPLHETGASGVVHWEPTCSAPVWASGQITDAEPGTVSVRINVMAKKPIMGFVVISPTKITRSELRELLYRP